MSKKQKPKENWEVEFDERFVDNFIGEPCVCKVNRDSSLPNIELHSPDVVKSFIRNLLQSQKEELLKQSDKLIKNFKEANPHKDIEIITIGGVHRIIIASDKKDELRKNVEGMKKEFPQKKELPEKYKNSVEINDETLPIIMHNARVMCAINEYEIGYNQALYDVLALLEDTVDNHTLS